MTVDLITKMAHKWLTGREYIPLGDAGQGWLVSQAIWAERSREAKGFITSIKNGRQLKTYALFISGILHLIFSLQQLMTSNWNVVNKTLVEGLLYQKHRRNKTMLIVLMFWCPLYTALIAKWSFFLATPCGKEEHIIFNRVSLVNFSVSFKFLLYNIETITLFSGSVVLRIK